jgi:hypothetical protein
MFRVLRTLSAHQASSRELGLNERGSPRRIRGRTRPPGAGAFLLLLGLLSLGGCKGSGADLPALAPVKGTVTLDGKPLTSGQVTLLPQNVEKGKELAPSTGQIDSSGNYEITTGGKAGAPLGPAKLTVSPSMDKGFSKTDYNVIYSNPAKTSLKFTVVEKAAPGTYDLKLTK